MASSHDTIPEASKYNPPFLQLLLGYAFYRWMRGDVGSLLEQKEEVGRAICVAFSFYHFGLTWTEGSIGVEKTVTVSALVGKTEGSATSYQIRTQDGDLMLPEESSRPAAQREIIEVEVGPANPLDLGRHRRDNVTRRQLKIDYPRGNQRKIKKFYTRQNKLIDQFLGAEDEERLQIEEDVRVGPKIRFAVNASFAVNFGLFIIQVYAAVSTGSLSVNLAHWCEAPTIIGSINWDKSSLLLQRMPLSVPFLLFHRDLSVNWSSGRSRIVFYHMDNRPLGCYT